MTVEVRAPEAADEVTEITLLSWRRREGDQVRAGEAICDVEYGKSVVEVEAQASEKHMADCSAVLAVIDA